MATPAAAGHEINMGSIILHFGRLGLYAVCAFAIALIVLPNPARCAETSANRPANNLKETRATDIALAQQSCNAALAAYMSAIVDTLAERDPTFRERFVEKLNAENK